MRISISIMTSNVVAPLFLIGLDCAFSANILIFYDLPSPSHQLFNYAFAEGMISEGHNVTMLGPFSDRGNTSDKYHPLVVEGTLDSLAENKFNAEQSLVDFSPVHHPTVLKEFGRIVCNHSYHTKGFRALMNYPKYFRFDLIVADVTLTPCFIPFIQRFGYPPTIGITAFLLPAFVSYNFGNRVQPSYLPLHITDYSENMTFFQRVFNYVYTYLEIFVKNHDEREVIEKIARSVFGERMESIESIQRHITLVLCNLNPAIGYPQPLTPNIVPVGGLHVTEAKKLPTDLQTIADKAKNGLILFSLGTNVRSSNLKAEVKLNLLEVFAKLNQTVVWKFESHLENLPKNVVIRKWLPQNDILGHPNTRLFISHGGALSTYEAIYHMVPIIGMPFYLDQKTNINRMVEKKLAIKIDIKDFTPDELLESINELLSNPIYRKNFKDYSKRMKDQPQPPLERAVFWAEYAMRHNGAQFLNPKARDMSIFVLSGSDVVLFLVSIVVLIVYMLVALKKMCLYFKTRPLNKQKLH